MRCSPPVLGTFTGLPEIRKNEYVERVSTDSREKPVEVMQNHANDRMSPAPSMIHALSGLFQLQLQVCGTLRRASTPLGWHVLAIIYLHSALYAAGAIAPVSSCERLVAFDD